MLTETTRGKQCGPAALRPALDAPAGCSPRLSWGAALLAFTLLLAGTGCAHKELLAPCSDYKAAAFSTGAHPSTIPCDTPLQMHRPPWVTAAEASTPSAQEG